MKIEKYAAIDIGSNAIRILIANVFDDNNEKFFFSKNALVRMPIRLGQDTFTTGSISKKNIKKMLSAFKAFKLIMKIHKVIHFNVYATSALREARNKLDVINFIRDKTGILIEIIDGKKEARLTSSTNFFKGIDKRSNFLNVDVGGGSTEFSIIQNGKRVLQKSFKIGTVRIINDMVPKSLWNELKKWIKKASKNFDKLSLLGTGGNINKIHKITATNDGMPISLEVLELLYKKISSLSYDQRIVEYQMNPDRADVILPAFKIYLKAMRWSKISKIFVPKKGLCDGMIEELHYSIKKL